MLEKAKCFVWSNATSQKPATRITILDLETEQRRTVTARKSESIRVLGAIDSSVVYGYVRNSDMYNSEDGERISPVYKLVIADSQGEILKEYQTKNVYIIKTNVDKDIIQLKRVRKIGQKFKKIADDSIQHQQDNTAKSFDLTSRVTDKNADREIYYSAGRLPDEGQARDYLHQVCDGYREYDILYQQPKQKRFR